MEIPVQSKPSRRTMYLRAQDNTPIVICNNERPQDMHIQRHPHKVVACEIVTRHMACYTHISSGLCATNNQKKLL